MTKFQWLFQQFNKKLWVRTSMFGVLSIATALAAYFFKDYIPEDTSQKIGAESVDGLLNIIASSMLAVTTFSLSIMVAAYSAATTNATPRSTQLLLADNTSQNALSVFIGSFIFSIVSIIALTMGIYGSSGRLILFGVTVAVITVIVMVLIQWVNYLSRLGRVSETIDMVERETEKALRNLLKNPYLGGNPLVEFTPDSNLYPLSSLHIGYVQHIDMQLLNENAKEYDCKIYVRCLPGDFCDGITPLLYASCTLTEDKTCKLAKAFSIGGERSFAQDPRFGMIVLSEIASRALSPAVNDPGTAIDVIGTGLRVLMPWVRSAHTPVEIQYPNIFVPPVQTSELLDIFFSPISRDGASIIEMNIHLHKALASLAAAGDSLTAELAKHYSCQAFKRAQKALPIEEDVKKLSSWVLQ